MGRLYVYALADERLRKTTLQGHTIEALRVGGIYALAERTEDVPAVSEENLRAQHAIVIELARRVSAILPARFGSLVDRDELEQIVALRGAILHEALELVRGREQMTVRLIGDDAVAVAAAEPRTETGAGKRYLEMRRAAAGYPLPEAVDRLARALEPHVAAHRAEPGAGTVRAVLYHLIPRGGSAEYRRELERAAPSAAPFSPSVSGPWPPFAFAPELLG
jgi:hypothetical protein